MRTGPLTATSTNRTVTALDTSVVIAALLASHEHHTRALPVVWAALDGRMAVLPLPALLEAFAVLTRLPPHLRLRPAYARAALEANFRHQASLVSLDTESGWPLLEAAGAAGIAGGAIYDFQILQCAKRAGATRLATLNRRHFERFDLGDLTLVVP